LLDDLRAAHPGVEWESCASGGGRIDLGVIERVERFWTSDMTDALARQRIQRWTGQLVPPEYLGAHVSAPRNHQTGRQFHLDFRAATAFFGSFGVEWDLTKATQAELARLAEWIAAYKRHRALLHTGRVFRIDTAQEPVYVHGVVAADGQEAIAGYVQLDETGHEPAPLIVPGLDPNRRYRTRQLLPATDDPRHRAWRGEGRSYTGAVIGRVGIPAPSRAPETVTVIHLVAE
ncbi:MAG TPA: alpha-galactosidase, partial [Jatrophihabitans sp.]